MSITIVGGGNPSGPTFPVQRSVRLRASASAYFNRTFVTPTNQNIWTYSGWFKLGQAMVLLSKSTGTFYEYIAVDSTGQFFWVIRNAGGTIAKQSYATSQKLRDPAGWYHICVRKTASLTVDCYVNNASVALTTQTTGSPTDAINSAVAHNIGWEFDGATNQYSDSYLTEVNFIDGQALTPTSFGAYNSYGVWSPAKYSGTYGTNGFYLPFTTNTNSETLGLDYANTNPELITNGMFTANVTGWTVTPGTGGSPSITWQSAHTARLANINAFGATYYQAIPTVIGQTYYAQCYTSNISLGGSTRVAQMLKGDDVNFSTNLVVIGNVQQSAGAGGIRNTFVATATTTYIGIQADIGGVSGSADFTQISVALGGYKNSWNPFNISTTAGVTYDSMLDVPTNTSATNANFAVMSPITGTTNLSNGNLYLTGAGAYRGGYGSITLPSTGKCYWEGLYVQANNNLGFGLAVIGSQTPLTPLTGTGAIGFNNAGQWWVESGSVTSSGNPGWSAATVVGMRYDASTGEFSYTSNGSTWTTIVTGTSRFTGKTWVPAAWCFATNDQITLNFGQRPFTYTPPTGYLSLNTYNIPAPTIPNGAAYMAATTYTGNGTTSTITNTVNGVSFQPDLVWIKGRSAVSNHGLSDSLRQSGGLGYVLYSDLTNAESLGGAYAYVPFNSNGFTTTNNANANTNAATYVGWQWKANGTPAVTNTSGSIPSTISANTTAGFSIVTYTGTGANATVGHGLGVAPKMVIVKQRNSANSWIVYQSSLGATKYLRLETTDASATATAVWNDTAPTSSVFTVGTSGTTNGSTATYVAYCWAEIPGFSKFGSFVGTGSGTTAPFVYCGFRPRWIMYKCTTAAENWELVDTSRNPYNAGTDQWLYPNLSNAEGTTSAGASTDILSNGFKLRGFTGTPNTSGATYIYAAFAENPFNYSLAR